MARKAFPRSNASHATVAARILSDHAQATGTPITLPVPIELIIEQSFRLEILHDELPEPPGTVILGALSPRLRRIVLNATHQAMFDTWIGPERFTLAHELAHWVYDAENPDQLTLDIEDETDAQFCYHRESPGLSETLRLREMNANKLAAHLLLPEALVRGVNITELRTDLRGTAAAWGVSLTTLRIRLEELGLLEPTPPA